MKCACIATNVGAINEIIDNGRDGLIISPGDTNNLAKNILGLLEDKTKLKGLQENANKKALKKFSSQTMAKKTIEVYKEMLK